MAKAKQIRVVLMPGPTDPALESAAFQKELDELGASLKPYKPQVPARIPNLEAVAAPPGDIAGQLILLGEFVFHAASTLPVKALAELFLNWKNSGAGREISLEVDGSKVKATAHTVEDIAALFEIAEKHQK